MANASAGLCRRFPQILHLPIEQPRPVRHVFIAAPYTSGLGPDLQDACMLWKKQRPGQSCTVHPCTEGPLDTFRLYEISPEQMAATDMEFTAEELSIKLDGCGHEFRSLCFKLVLLACARLQKLTNQAWQIA